MAWDTADPERPAVTHSIEAADLSGMAVDGGLLYVVTHGGQLITYDLSDPATPVEIHRADGLANGWQPTVVGDWLYVADNTAGVVVYRSPTAGPRPSPARSRPPADPGAGRIGGRLRALRGRGGGVEAFRLSNPAFPTSIGRTNPHTSAISVDVGDMGAATRQTWWPSTSRCRCTGSDLQTRQWARHAPPADTGPAGIADESHAADSDLAVSTPSPLSTTLRG